MILFGRRKSVWVDPTESSINIFSGISLKLQWWNTNNVSDI